MYVRYLGDASHETFDGEALAATIAEPENLDKLLIATMTAESDTSLSLTWTKIRGAQGAEIYFGPCASKKSGFDFLASVEGNAYTITGLTAGSPYQAYVRAWRVVDGEKQYLQDSPEVYAYTSGSNRYTNPGAVTLTASTLTASTLTVRLEKTASIKATVTGAEQKKKVISKAKKLRYYSDDTSVATVNASGKVKGVGKGSCQVYVLANNGIYNIVTVTVDMSPTGIKLTGVPKNLYAGGIVNLAENVKLTPVNSETTLIWSSSDPTVATVSIDGTVTGIKDGKVTITVAASNGKTAKVAITVKTRPTKISFASGAKTVGIGETLDLSGRVKLTPDDVKPQLKWSSSNPEVATVSQSGKVTGVKKGKANIVVEAENGKTAKITITVSIYSVQ